MKLLRTILPLLIVSTPAAGQWLHDARPVPVGDQPHDLASGDLDGDGQEDLVVLCGPGAGGPSQLSSLLALENGLLSSGITFGTADGATAVALADITGDGKLDVLTAHPSGGLIVVRAGLGAGLFGPPSSVSAGGAAVALSVGDLDLDGDLDVCTANGADASISRLFAAGGALGTGVASPMGGAVQSLAVSRVDADGWPDVLLLRAPVAAMDTFTLLKGVGGGALDAGTDVFTAAATDWKLADLDADQDLDLLLCTTNDVRVALNGGDGVLTAGFISSPGGELQGVATADFDQDGNADLVAVARQQNRLLFWRGTGPASFAAGPPVITSALPERAAILHGPAGRAAVCTLAPSQDIVWQSSANDARLRLGTTAASPSGDGPKGVALGDLDGDGDLDAVVTSTDKDLFHRLLNNGSGAFGLKKSITAQQAYEVDLADIDGDGDLDAVSHETSDLQAFLNNGAGSFTALPGFGGTWALYFHLRDMNGDGRPDVVLADYELSIMLGDGAAGFGPPTSMPLIASGVQGNGGFDLADLDGDGDVDLVSAHKDSYETKTWLNDGLAAFTLASSVRTGGELVAPRVADYDGDGLPDVAVSRVGTGPLDGNVAFLRGDGAGHLEEPLWITTPRFDLALAGDVNGDGLADLVTAGHEDSVGQVPFEQVHVLAGADDGLVAPSPVADESGFAGLALGDLDGDGRLDVVTTDANNKVLRRFLNASSPHPWHELGHALAGAKGPPQLAPAGWMEPGTSGHLRLLDAAPNALALLFVSASSSPLPFKGGTFVPVPPIVHLALITDSAGVVDLSWSSWPPLIAGEDWFFQAVVVDAGAPQGVALSEALRLIQP